MTNFCIGVICGMVELFLCLFIIAKIDDIRIKKELGEDYENIIMSKSEIEKYKKYMNEQHIQD
jgi:hypothetical protein